MKIAITAAVALATAAGAGIEHNRHEAGRRTDTTAVAPSQAAFRPAPIRADWILAGAPVTEAAEVARTADGSAQVHLWRTTAATFRWIHEADEIVTILAGEVFVTDADGTRRRLGPGDVALFPAGADQVWEVPESLLKSAILKPRLPGPVEAAQRWLRRARSLIAGAPAVFG